jgi:glycosyltransferase involved in cell wall biosynthesis
MQRLTALFVHGPRNVGGDTTVLLQTIEHLDPDQITAIVAATPDGEAWQRFKALASATPVRLIGVDMGVTGTDAGAPRRSRVTDTLVIARALWQLLAIVRRERVHVVYTLDRSRAVLLATLAARLLRRGLVFHAHYPYYPSARWSLAVVRAADCVVAISDFIRREYEQRGIEPRRIRIVYNGIDAAAYAPRHYATLVRAQLGLADDEQLVLLPGRLSRYKGQLELIDALPAILAHAPRVRCVFAGYDSPELGDLVVPGCGTVGAVLTRRASELGVAERVLLTGATDQMAELYSAADVVVIPSWAEPFGLVVAEAMAAARPIVAAAGGAIPELIDHGVSGLLVPPRDPPALAEAVIRLLREPAFALRLGKTAQQVVREKFTIARYSSEIQAVLLEVAARRK